MWRRKHYRNYKGRNGQVCFGVMVFVLNCYTLPVIKAKIMNFWALLFWYCFCLFFSSCIFGGFLNTWGFLVFVSSIDSCDYLHSTLSWSFKLSQLVTEDIFNMKTQLCLLVSFNIICRSRFTCDFEVSICAEIPVMLILAVGIAWLKITGLNSYWRKQSWQELTIHTTVNGL